ncbi:hypothetical protein PS655_06065 [Pseudomonas fluorescens]|uniref:Uncharacterized protein n=1 Tax=Pseudomonas fluorescens TaxID=294 RepID=A0A5E6Y2Z7_PSEFL|nr:hypothetical protein PS655_05183 [Pseudomonas fluorescens]VVN48218.1 hypothetical protein PS655_06065 [Pseudomonas fluorescens]
MCEGRRVPARGQFGAQFTGTGLTPIAAARGKFFLRQRVQQGLRGIARIGHQRQVRRVVTHGLVGVDIDAQQFAGNLETASEGHVVIGLGQFSADG